MNKLREDIESIVHSVKEPSVDAILDAVIKALPMYLYMKDYPAESQLYNQTIDEMRSILNDAKVKGQEK